MSWSKVKYFFLIHLKKKKQLNIVMKKEQTDMKKQQDPLEQQDVTFPQSANETKCCEH